MTVLARIADRIVGRPLLVHPAKMPMLLAMLDGRIAVDAPNWNEDALGADLPAAARQALLEPAASRFVGSRVDEERRTGLPYQRTAEGAAVISVLGSLVNRGAWLGASSGVTSYEGIKFQLQAAVRDPKVKGIILDIASPGGEAIGASDAAAAVRAAAAEKPVVAVVNGMAASAAYWLASGARGIVISEDGVAGSIGVVLLHADFSRALDKAGISPTFIFAGAHKVDANPYEPLGKEVRADLQAEIDTLYGMFTAGVAQGRRLSVDAVRRTEARTYIGSAAVAAGLADAVGTFETALAELSRAPAVSYSTARQLAASPKAESTSERLYTAAELNAAVLAERQRVCAIFELPSANGLAESASIIARQTNLSVDAADGILKAAAAAPRFPSLVERATDIVVDASPPGTPRQTGAASWESIVAELQPKRHGVAR